VGRDRLLIDDQVVGNLLLRPALQVQVGHLLAALEDGEIPGAAARHLVGSFIRLLTIGCWRILAICEIFSKWARICWMFSAGRGN
jgi:hypothetical protein